MKQIQTTLDEYVFTADDVLLEGNLAVGQRFEEADFNRKIVIREREAHRVKLFLYQIDQREKTLVFCRDQDYFTIYDFVKAHQHFSDPEWDGEPQDGEPQDAEPCRKCGEEICLCEPVERKPCKICGARPCECPKDPCDVCHRLKCVCDKNRKIQVKLADGKAREIQHMMMTSFWHPDGTPMSSQQFMEMLFGKLPEFFQDETELRDIWSSPDTRAGLLESLAAEGFGPEQLAEMQRTIDAQNSDLFDVLAYVAYALPKLTRADRAAMARLHIDSEFDDKQRAFLDFVLGHYVAEGVEELDQKKLTPLLRLKYHDSLSDALADLGKPEEIGRVFAGFQMYLYQQV